MHRAGVLPDAVNVPPAYSRGPPPSSNSTSTFTEPAVKPLPTADHCVPFHRAIAIVFGSDAAAVDDPPTYNWLPVPSSWEHKTYVPWLHPAPNADHACPFHRAILFTGTPPAVSRLPAAYSPGPVPSS